MKTETTVYVIESIVNFVLFYHRLEGLADSIYETKFEVALTRSLDK